MASIVYVWVVKAGSGEPSAYRDEDQAWNEAARAVSFFMGPVLDRRPRYSIAIEMKCRSFEKLGQQAQYQQQVEQYNKWVAETHTLQPVKVERVRLQPRY